MVNDRISTFCNAAIFLDATFERLICYASRGKQEIVIKYMMTVEWIRSEILFENCHHH
jgi:hypothetical protein